VPVAGDAAEEHKVTVGPSATKVTKITQLRDDLAYALRRRSPLGLGLLVGLAGLFMVGVLGGAVGFLAGAAAARRAQCVLAAAGVALLASAALTILEQPLSDTEISAFPADHHLAEVAAAIAAVLLLAGLVGMVARRDQATMLRVPPPKEFESTPAGRKLPERLPTSTIAAVLAAVLLASLILLQLGDQRWHPVAIAVAIAVLILAVVLAVARSRRLRAVRLDG
jgi:peptidoglycan/LPS O-acetylase OafA/YrhL